MNRNIKKAICLSLILSTAACASTKRASRNQEKSRDKEQSYPQKGTPNREGFIPLSPPVFIDGAPNLDKKEKNKEKETKENKEQ